LEEINLYELLRYYSKKWIIIVLFIIIGLIGGIIYNQFVQVPKYTSNATLLLVDKNPTSTTAVTDATLINNYIALIESHSVLDPVISNSNINESYNNLEGSIKATNPVNTEIIQLSISSNSTSKSRESLNDIMDSFRVEIKKLYNLDNIQIVDNASTPSSPSNIHTTAQLVVAALIGLIMSIIVVFFMYDYVINNRNTHKSISKKSSATIVTPDRAKKISKTRSKKSTLKKKVNSKKK
jgi:capsular polysaccharide biosynthesis protein